MDTKDINIEVQKLINNNKFYISRKIKTTKKKNYWSPKKDPDGKLRFRLTTFERNKFINNNQDLIKDIKKLNPKSILDIGCGAGFLLSAFNRKKYKLYGVENDLEAIHFAKKYGKIIRHDLSHKPFSSITKFDLIIANQVIEHMKKPENLIKLVKKNIKKKGIFVIGTPDFDCMMARFYKKKFRMLHDKTHVSLFSRESLIRFLSKDGFEILKIDYPYFGTEYFENFKKKSLVNFFDNKKKVSPPFYGNIINIYSRLKY